MPGPAKATTASSRNRQRATQARKRRLQSVNLGTAVTDWNIIKCQEHCKTDEEIAQILINTYKSNEDRKRKRLVSSTPGIPPFDDLSGWSGVSSIKAVGVELMSGVEMLTDSSQSESGQRTTSELESFNNHILMYASKRQSFTYNVYKCRCQLAAIDYMKHLDRPYRKNKKGDQCYCRRFSKAANHWGVKPEKVKKDYSYIKELLLDIIQGHISREYPMSHEVKLLPEDPMRLAKNIAAVEPPPTQQLVQEQKRRLQQNWAKPGTSSDF